MVALITIVIIAILVVSFFSISKFYEDTVLEKTMTSLNEVTNYNRELFETTSNSLFNILSITDRLPKGDRTNFTEDIIKLLKSVRKSGGFVNVIVAYKEYSLDDIAIYSADQVVENDSDRSQIVTIRENDYYFNALQGKRSIKKRHRYVNPEDDTISADVIIFSMPIYDNGEIIAVSLATLSMEAAGSMLFSNETENKTYTLIANSEGEVLVGNNVGGVVLRGEIEETYKKKGKAIGTNIFDFLSMTSLSSSEIQKIRRTMVNGEDGGVFSFSYNSSKYNISYVKSSVEDNYIFSIISNSIIYDEVKTVENMLLLFSLIIVLLFVMVLIYVIIQRSRVNLKLSNVNRRFRTATKMINGCIFEINLADNMIVYFENSDQIFGLDSVKLFKYISSRTEFLESSTDRLLRAIFAPEDEVIVEDAFVALMEKDYVVFEARVKHEKKGLIWCKAHLSLVTDKYSAPVSIIGFLTDINEIKKELLSDPLTGALNKVAIATAVDTMLRVNSYKKNALLMLDIDDFKSINDTYGHSFGDAVLIDIVSKLKNIFPTGLIGRVGGDEFVVFLSDIAENKVAVLGANALNKSFKQTYSKMGALSNMFTFSCSIGITYSDGEKKFKDLFPKADVALYKAKQKGKDCYYIFTNKEKVDINKLDGTALMPTAEDASRRMHMKDRIFEVLHSSVNFDNSINMVLRLIGEFSKSSRVYVVEKKFNQKAFSITYQWSSDETFKKYGNLNKKSCASSLAYSVLFENSSVFYCPDTNMLKGFWGEHVKKRNVLSCLQIAFVENGTIRGFIGIDDCFERNPWSIEELDTLVYTAKLMGTFILKERTEKALVKLFKAVSAERANDETPDVYISEKVVDSKILNNKIKKQIMNKDSDKEDLDLIPNVDTGTIFIDEDEVKDAVLKRKQEEKNKEIENQIDELTVSDEDSLKFANPNIPLDNHLVDFGKVAENQLQKENQLGKTAKSNEVKESSLMVGDLNNSNKLTPTDDLKDNNVTEKTQEGEKLFKTVFDGKYSDALIIDDDDIETYSEDSEKFANPNISYFDENDDSE